MSLSAPVALIFGAGKNIGASVAKSFSDAGYKIATVSRSESSTPASDRRIHIRADLSDPSGIAAVFETVRKQLGQPSVVVYNGAANSYINKENPLSLPLKEALHDYNINTLSALASAKEAVASFETLPKDASRTYIYTGNITNLQPIPMILSNGMGKSAAAHFIQASAQVFKARGYKFYYADERKADGTAVYGDIDGEGAGKFYLELSEKPVGPWLATFVKGKGYVDFSSPKSNV